MAIDTAAKRASSLHFAKPMGTIPPTGTTSNVRRGAALALYMIAPYVVPTLIVDFVNNRGTSSTLACTQTSSTLTVTGTRVDE